MNQAALLHNFFLRFRTAGLNITQLLILTQLAAVGRPMRIDELFNGIGLTTNSANYTHSIAKLKELELTSETNRKPKHISITPKGLKLLKVKATEDTKPA